MILAARTIGASLLALVVAGCHGIVPTQPTAFNPADFAPIAPTPPAPPAAPPPGPHFALEIQAATSPAYEEDPWIGLVSVWANPNILSPELPARVVTTCGATTQTHALGAGTASFACRLSAGVHRIGAVAEMTDGRRYPTAISATVIARPGQPPPPPPPTPTPRPPPSPAISLNAIELHKNTTEATWRFSVNVERGTLDDAEFDCGAGSRCGGPCTVDSEDDYLDVEYKIAGTKDVRVAATVDGKTLRASRQIAVTFAP